jgi:hypothetical protein
MHSKESRSIEHRSTLQTLKRSTKTVVYLIEAYLSLTREFGDGIMASARATINLIVPPDEVWDLIGGFGSLPDWMPNIRMTSLSQGGRVRHLNTPDGLTMVERLERYDLRGRTYSYSILQAPFPVADYLSKLTVTATDVDKGSHVEWAATFAPKGVSNEDAHNLFQGIFSDGLRALTNKYANRK